MLIEICPLSVVVVSSPEPKARLSFSDQNLSVVVVNFSHFHLLLQNHLAQSIIGSMGFKFVQMKGPNLFQGEIYKIVKIHLQNLKKRTTEPI